MKAKEIRATSEQELGSRLFELKKELMKLSAEVAASNPKNPSRVKQIKRTIARMLTIISEQQKKKEEK